MAEITGLYQNLALTTLVSKRPRGAHLAPLIFAALNVPKMSGTIYRRLPNSGDLIPHDTYRAPGSEAKVLWEDNPITEPFTIRDHSLSSLLPDEMRDVDAPLNEEINKVENIVDALDLAREIEVVSKISAAATAASHTEAAPEKWDATTPSEDPIKYILSKIGLILSKTGKRPNVLAMDFDVAAALFLHTSVKDMAKYTLNQTDMSPTVDIMAKFLSAALGIQQVVIAETGWISAGGRGTSNPTLSKIWGDNVFLGLVEKPSLEFGGFGLQLKYNGPGATYGQQVRNGYLVETARAASRKADAYYVHNYFDDVIINPEAGFWITDTLT